MLALNLQRITRLGVLALGGLYCYLLLFVQVSQAIPRTQNGQSQDSKPGKPTSSSQAGKDGSAAPSSRGSGDSSSKDSEATTAKPSRDTYRIGIGDQLQISVWQERDLSLSVVVRPDGMITMPLLNDLYVVGQTPKELADLLTVRLKAFVNEPQVTVSVSQIQSRKVFLVGQVGHPGAYPLNDGKTVFELITEAGGLGTFAKKNSIYVLRVVDGKQQKIPFHYKSVVTGQGGDIALLPGDRVIVP